VVVRPVPVSLSGRCDSQATAGRVHYVTVWGGDGWGDAVCARVLRHMLRIFRVGQFIATYATVVDVFSQSLLIERGNHRPLRWVGIPY